MTGHSMFRSRQWLSWRSARWAVLAAAIPVLWACNARRLEAPNPAPQRVFTDLFQQAINRDIDILFMIDDSLSMMPLQTKLLTNFPVFMNVLKALPGGLPNVHVAIVSSDLGAGIYDAGDIPACRHGGDQGIFRSTPRGTCAASPLAAGQTFIQDVNGVKNYTGDIAAAFTCLAAIGDQGCGFEHQFGSVLRALGADGNAPPPENAMFLRPNAFLAIILITNEDDCSAPLEANPSLFDPTSRFVSDPLGPLASYRCNEYGHLCGGQHPPRTPAGPTDLSGTCVSAEDGRLLKVADVVAKIKALKPDPSKVLVAAIAGDPSPYVVKVAPPQLKDDPSQWPFIEHSCTTAIDYADPGIRVKEWVDAFAGVFLSICNDTFAPALMRIAEEIGKVIGSPCVEGTVLDVNGVPLAGGARPDCTVIDHTFSDQGIKIDTPLAACADNGNTAPCWALAVDAKCPGAHIMTFNRPAGLPPASDLNSSVACSVLVCPPPAPPGSTLPRPPGC
jgi:hypothetical protein